MKNQPYKPKYKLNIKNIEVKKENDLIPHMNMNIGLEILKTLALIIATAIFVIFHFVKNQEGKSSEIIRKIYYYSIGLSFGDTIIFIIIGSYISLFISWILYSYRKYFFRWFYRFAKVDFWLVRKRILTTLWFILLWAALVYHHILLSARVNNYWYYTQEDVKNIFVKGWYASFTKNYEVNDPKNWYPNTTNNIGVFFDTLFNLPYAITFSPYVSLIFVLISFLIISIYFFTINPFAFFKNLKLRKMNILQVEHYLKKTSSIFYYTEESKRLFEFYKLAARVLKIDITKVSYKTLVKEINGSLDALVQNEQTAKFFLSKKYNKNEITQKRASTDVLETKELNEIDLSTQSETQYHDVNYDPTSEVSITNESDNQKSQTDQPHVDLAQTKEIENLQEPIKIVENEAVIPTPVQNPEVNDKISTSNNEMPNKGVEVIKESMKEENTTESEKEKIQNIKNDENDFSIEDLETKEFIHSQEYDLKNEENTIENDLGDDDWISPILGDRK
ncbi:hypothetical protein [Mycoplasmopsis opalescens]|uniref:hypothetical protein n=1 Tax=Mycoplasmopsis opalescens TaxID=114886 RepID=UPI00068D639F|nr:hypothetical protein [Mycoplasmopsis opalescens]